MNNDQKGSSLPLLLYNNNLRYDSLAEENIHGKPKVRLEEEYVVDRSSRKSCTAILFLYILYGITFSLLISGLPGLTMQLTKGDAAKSSILYGLATSTRYCLEFFSAPILGSIADQKGRKPIFIFAFCICGLEYTLLCLFPSIFTVFFTRAISGLGDAGVATAYAMITDVALYN